MSTHRLNLNIATTNAIEDIKVGVKETLKEIEPFKRRVEDLAASAAMKASVSAVSAALKIEDEPVEQVGGHCDSQTRKVTAVRPYKGSLMERPIEPILKSRLRGV